MLKAIVSTLRFIILVLAGHKEIALENAAFSPLYWDPVVGSKILWILRSAFNPPPAGEKEKI
jgi:hypothetical protein